ncbi:MAG TPA: DUF1015 domain-containing protein [Polyangiaceae bacterium]
MAEIAPLQPLRYDPSLLSRVVAPPYDVIDAALRKELGARHPKNVVHIDLPEGDGDARYENARRLFEEWQAQGVLIRDEEPAFWRYAQTFSPPGGGASLTRKGFFALVRAVPFSDREVLPHERTLTGPKLDRMALSRATRATLSPQFMLYSDPERALDADLDLGQPFAEFSTHDGVSHQLGRIRDQRALAHITSAIAKSRLLIADGHHRYETAVALSEEIEREARAGGASPDVRAEHHYTFALLANGDDPGLVVFPTHRLVHSLKDFDFDQLLERAAELFAVTAVVGDVGELVAQLARVDGPTVCSLARGGRAALLRARSDVDFGRHPTLGKRPAVVRKTAVALLHDGLLEHVLGITPEAQAAKTNLRYLQQAGQGSEALERGEGQVLFLMNPTSVATIREVSEAGEVMPQKSTFFYPKVPTGLFFHTLHPNRVVT